MIILNPSEERVQNSSMWYIKKLECQSFFLKWLQRRGVIFSFWTTVTKMNPILEGDGICLRPYSSRSKIHLRSHLVLIEIAVPGLLQQSCWECLGTSWHKPVWWRYFVFLLYSVFLLGELEGGVIHYSKQAVTSHTPFLSVKWYIKYKQITL